MTESSVSCWRCKEWKHADTYESRVKKLEEKVDRLREYVRETHIKDWVCRYCEYTNRGWGIPDETECGRCSRVFPMPDDKVELLDKEELEKLVPTEDMCDCGCDCPRAQQPLCHEGPRPPYPCS